MLTPSPAAAEKQVHTVPVGLAVQVVELVERWQIPRAELLSGLAMGTVVLEDPLARVPIAAMCELLERARLVTGEPGLGYYLGLQKRVSMYGYLGFAALSAPSIRQALELAVKFAPIFSTALSIDLKIDGEVAALRVEEHADLGAARDIVHISLMLGLQTIGSALTGQEGRRSLDFAFPEPECHARFAHLAPRWRFGQPCTQLRLDTASLDAPIVTADHGALALARTLCERSLDELGFDAGLADRVRKLVASETGEFRSLDRVATLVHLSPRTLKRRLAAQGVSFSSLVERERLERALVLLQSSRLPIEDVAEQLDYATASTFVRAFHRWTGTTPSAYRRERWYGARAG